MNASFNRLTYPITATAAPAVGGTVSCDPNPVAHGESSLCMASVASGYAFLNWSGHCTGISPTCTLSNVTAARSVNANFFDIGVFDINQSTPAVGYRAGSLLTINGSFNDRSGRTPLSLLWRPRLPAGWTLASVSGEGSPEISQDGSEILFTGSLGAMPIDFSYQISVPADAEGDQALGAAVEYQNSALANPVVLVAQPDPLTVPQITYHSADYRDARWQIDGSEASRVLAYWRATAYHVDADGVDGYAPNSGSSDGSRHSADYREPHWQIDSSEANRVLAYWRATAYHADPAGVDGYAPGAEPAGTQVLAEATASHSAPAYVPGDTLMITNSLDRPAESTLLSLLWTPSLPVGWTISAVSGDGGPELGPDGKSILFRGALTANPLRFTYQVSVPDGTAGSQSLIAQVEYHVSGSVNAQDLTAQPQPLVVAEMNPEEDLTIEGSDLIGDGIHEFVAAGNITVSGSVSVGNGVRLILRAGKRISFMPGFKVNAGGGLSARIE